MNRHHYSLFVHGCRFIFLLRQDPSGEKKYKPAEFHWKLTQVRERETRRFCAATGPGWLLPGRVYLQCYDFCVCGSDQLLSTGSLSYFYMYVFYT